MPAGLENPRNTESKFAAFNELSFTEICIGLNQTGKTLFLLLPINGKSLRSLFESGAYIQTNKGRAAWRSLISGSSLHTSCFKEGINVKSGNGIIMARIGLAATPDLNCYYSDSYIGLGTVWNRPQLCTTNLTAISCGNRAFCFPDNGDKSLPAHGYILIK